MTTAPGGQRGRRGRRTRAAVAGAAVAGAAAAVGAWARVRRAPGHPVFARFYGVFARLAEHGELGERRRLLASGAHGLTLELGAGTGESFKHYRPPVTAVVAVEPDPTMARQAVPRSREAAVPVRLVLARAESLPFRDGTFATAVATLVLCSVDDPARTLAEARRVLRRDGRLLFLEHVRAESGDLARWQDRLERPWGAMTGACHPNRPTLASIRAAGFEPEEVEAFDLRPGVPIVHPHIQGSARVP